MTHQVDATNKRPAKCTLEPMDLHNPEDFEELLAQRKLCGWDMEPAVLEKWRRLCDEKRKNMFWIIPTAPGHAPEQMRTDGDSDRQWQQQQQQQRLRVGHICLQSYDDPPDPRVASEDKSVMMISTFFIKPEYRSGGLGTEAVKALEGWAKTAPYGSPDCRAVTVHTVSRRYSEDDSDEFRGLYARRGLPTPERGRSNEDWYARMGYVKWKEERRYEDKLLDGTEIKLLAVYMSKDIS